MTRLSLTFSAPAPVMLTSAPGLAMDIADRQAVAIVQSPALALEIAPPATVSLTASPPLALTFPAPQPVTLQVQGIQGPAGAGGGGSAADSFETVSKNLAAVDYVGEQVSATTLIVTYANGIIKTIVNSEPTVTVTLSGATPGGIELVKTITLTGGDFATTYS